MSTAALIARVRSSDATAVDWAAESLRRARDAGDLNCFTTLVPDRAMATARAIDTNLQRLPLAGLPFAAKDLFDVEGVPTRAGARRGGEPPARSDATAIARLCGAGANLVGMTNMDEYAYGFSTENAHYGPTRNPHDPTRIAGGSSGGSAAAVAAGIVPAALGSDTNGSVRVPASLCGIYGLKPTFGRLSRAGTYPFVADLDHVGVFARELDLLGAVYNVLQGSDPRDPACADRAPERIDIARDRPVPKLRVGRLGGWFREGASEQALAALDHAAAAFADVASVDLAGARAARSAAFCMTAAAAASLHAARLRSRPMDFDPAVRDRLLAGLLLPAEVMFQVRRVRRDVSDQALALFDRFDVLLAPATPCAAPRIGEASVEIAGRAVPVRANLGLYTQPISFIGLPVIAAPVRLPGLPIGVQIIGPPWGEAKVFAAALHLEREGRVGAAPVPAGVDPRA